MNSSRAYILATTILAVVALTAGAVAEDISGEYRASSSPEQIQRQIRKLPTDRIWWSVNGADQAWNFKNLHLIFPTANVYRNGPVRELTSEPMHEIGAFEIDTPLGTMRFDDFIQSDQSTLMGIVVLHKGKIAYERYPRMQEHEQPIYWSVAKVMPATILRILEERGQLDVSRPIETYIPELAGSDFAGITVRNILDMATGLDCQDEYEDRQSCYYQYSMAIGDGFRDENASDNPYDFLKTLKVTKHAPQGTQ